MMAKGIIVVDNIPSTCKKCDYLDRSFLSESYCIASMSSIKITDGEKPDWCPIRKIPAKLEELKSPHSLREYQMKGFQCGWNACLNKILKKDD